MASQLLVEAFCADPQIVAMVEVLSLKLVHQYPLLNGHLDDLRQEMWLFLIQYGESYDADKAAPVTFCSYLFKSACRNYLAAQLAEKRKNIIGVAEITDYIEAEFMADAGCGDIFDFPDFIDGLSESQRQVCIMLSAGKSYRAIARELALPFSSFIRQYIIPLRAAVKNAGY